MAYAGVIAKVRKVRPLIMKNGEEASSVNLATVFGYQIGAFNTGQRARPLGEVNNL